MLNGYFEILEILLKHNPKLPSDYRRSKKYLEKGLNKAIETLETESQHDPSLEEEISKLEQKFKDIDSKLCQLYTEKSKKGAL